MKPAQYWREAKQIKEYLGKTGQVISSTVIRASSPEFNYLVPYSYVVVDFSGVKKEMMGAGSQLLDTGDRVVCVIRKMGQTDSKSLIEYGLKVEKIKELQ
ncbi:MAG: hypothetical protein OEX81_03870 [Candidatus Pacebacteria bacterium]|nr:hypothetical protein [Candidatus Paceibacterota bacterium]